MRKNLPLAFITHHPIVLFNFIYLIIACMQMDPAVSFGKAFYILPICLIFTNWEVVRKIRAPEQETGYTTYSKIFGPRPAILIAIVLQLVFITSVFIIFQKLETLMWVQVLFGLVQLLLLAPSIDFLVTLKLNRPLKPFAEAQILVIVGTLLTAALL